MARQIIIEGVEYKSITEACKKLKVNYNKVISRYIKSDNTATHEEIITELLKDKDRAAGGIKVTVGGKKYDTIAEACMCERISRTAISMYKNNHPELSIDEIFELYIDEKKMREEPFKFRDQWYQSLSLACKKYRIPFNKVKEYRRENRSISYENLFKNLVDIHEKEIILKRTPISLNGIRYSSIEAACERFNINFGCMTYNVNSNSPKYYIEMINICLTSYNTRDIPIRIYGKVYDSVDKACEELGLNIKNLKNQKEKFPELGYTALIMELKKSNIVDQGDKISAFGKLYKSTRTLCHYFCISEEAFDYYKEKLPDYTSEQLVNLILQEYEEIKIGEKTYKSLRRYCGAKKKSINNYRDYKIEHIETPMFMVVDKVNNAESDSN